MDLLFLSGDESELGIIGARFGFTLNDDFLKSFNSIFSLACYSFFLSYSKINYCFLFQYNLGVIFILSFSSSSSSDGSESDPTESY